MFPGAADALVVACWIPARPMCGGDPEERDWWFSGLYTVRNSREPRVPRRRRRYPHTKIPVLGRGLGRGRGGAS